MLFRSEMDANRGEMVEISNEVGGFKDGDIVTCGGVITEVALKTTKTGQRMAILNLEDMLGSINVVIFPKSYEKCKELLLEENVVAIKGKMSLRDGMLPSVNAESIELLSVEAQEEAAEEQNAEEVELPKLSLCLIYSVSNHDLHSKICNLLGEYPGFSDVYVKDEVTGAKYKLPQKVEIRKSLQYELETLIDKDKIIIA